jgi:hypothetical protein
VVPLSNHIGHVNPAAAHRHRSGFGLDADRLVAHAGAAGGALFAATHAFISSPIGVPLLFAWSAAWDAGYGFELPDAYPTEKAKCPAEQAYAAAGVRFPDPTSSALPVLAREEYHDRFDD